MVLYVAHVTPDGPELAYMRIVDSIAGQIEAGELRPGDRLLSERDLAEDYGVAYHTVRRAMEVLRERGLIVTVHGRGTFIRQQDAPPED